MMRLWRSDELDDGELSRPFQTTTQTVSSVMVIRHAADRAEPLPVAKAGIERVISQSEKWLSETTHALGIHMADIELRFHHDMLTLSAPIGYVLEKQGIDVGEDLEFMNLLEPDTVRDALKMQLTAGAQCLVTNTEGICTARLAHKRMEDRQKEIARAAVDCARQCTPQHLICEIGPSGLPLDPSSEVSLKQSTDQYAAAARALGDEGVDAFLLNGMDGVDDMRCAIEGVRSVSRRPIFASFDVDVEGTVKGHGISLGEAIGQLGDAADVYGFSTSADPVQASAIAQAAARATEAPLLAQIEVVQPTSAERRRASLGGNVEGNPYPLPDDLVHAAAHLCAAGVQFLRVIGQATPAYTGSMALVVTGLDARR